MVVGDEIEALVLVLQLDLLLDRTEVIPDVDVSTRLDA